jgi:gamma-glutamylaminecyclotransferase
MKNIFICGSALTGQPDHQNLQGAKLLKETMTLPRYRLHSVKDGWHPGIYEVATGGISIHGEVYEMTDEEYEYLLGNEPPHMYPATVKLKGGEEAIAMLYPKELIEKYNWQDISEFGSWAAYKSKVKSQKSKVTN